MAPALLYALTRNNVYGAPVAVAVNTVCSPADGRNANSVGAKDFSSPGLSFAVTVKLIVPWSPELVNVNGVLGLPIKVSRSTIAAMAAPGATSICWPAVLFELGPSPS